MKRILFSTVLALSLIGCAHAQPAQDSPLDQVVADYEAMIARYEPEAVAAREGRMPTGWPVTDKATIAARAAAAEKLRTQLSGLGLSADNPDAAILDALLTQLVSYDAYNERYVPFVGDWGFHAMPIFEVAGARIRSYEDAKALITRMNGIEPFFAANVENMREGMAAGITAHKDPLGTTMEQIAEQIVDKPEDSQLYKPFLNMPDTIPAETQDALRAEALPAVAKAVESYRGLQRFFESEYKPRTSPGIRNQPDGREHYAALTRHHTTRADLTPERVHQIGQSEVARIRAEMETIIDDIGFDGSFEDFVDFLRTDPQFYARTPDELMMHAATISKEIDAMLPRYFGKLPRLTYGVEPVPAAIAPGYTTGRYVQGDMKRGKAGTYLVNTYRLNQRPLYQLPALSAHEAVPGHHLQISLAQELEDVAEFRRSYYATSFGEGWGLYSEHLMHEAGLYKTPYEKFGAFSYEMWRACRLVSDTGMHWYGWSREKGEECFRKNTALAPHNIKTEVTRYIGWPGQALGYKIGEITIRDLRAEAEEALGADFDIRAFHDVVLSDGAVPMAVLEAKVRSWVAEQTGAQSSGTAGYP